MCFIICITFFLVEKEIASHGQKIYVKEKIRTITIIRCQETSPCTLQVV